MVTGPLTVKAGMHLTCDSGLDLKMERVIVPSFTQRLEKPAGQNLLS